MFKCIIFTFTHYYVNISNVPIILQLLEGVDMLKKTKRMTLVEQVAEQIEYLIEIEHWKVGDKLPPEMALMENFGVSRNTLREAIRALVHAGLLETKQGSGTIVRSKSILGAVLHRHMEKSSLLETLEVRFALEKEAAQLAAKYRTNEDIMKLEESIKNCQTAAFNEDIETFVNEDLRFHKRVVQAAHNQLLLDLYEYMTESLYSSIHQIMTMDNPFAYGKVIHRDLCQAIHNQDEPLAETYVNEYISHFKQRLQQMMGDDFE